MPIAGTVQVTGFAASDGRQVASATLSFKPVLKTVQPLQLGTLPKSFTGLGNVTLVPLPDVVPAATVATALVIDSVNGTTTS